MCKDHITLFIHFGIARSNWRSSLSDLTHHRTVAFSADNQAAALHVSESPPLSRIVVPRVDCVWIANGGIPVPPNSNPNLTIDASVSLEKNSFCVMEDTYGAVMVPKDELQLQLHPLHKKPFDIPDIGRVLQNLTKTREAGEFLSGALAGAMTKAILAPLETIRTRMVVGVGSKNISGSFVHARAVTGGFHGNVFVGSSLVDMYAKAKTVCAFLEELNDAVKVKFIEEQPEKLIESNPSFFSQFTLVIATQV